MPNESTVKSARRSLLFTPGDSQRKIDKIRVLAADAIFLDLEDAVAGSEKESARQIVCQALASVEFGRNERLVRVNGMGTGFFNADLTAVANAKPDAGTDMTSISTMAVREGDRYRVRGQKIWASRAEHSDLLLLPPATMFGVEAAMEAIPALGQHTETILAEIGYEPSQIVELRRAGV